MFPSNDPVRIHTPTKNKSKPFFENLNSLRFFAFLFVFIWHAFNTFDFQLTSYPRKIIYFVSTLNQAGGLAGVKFFFVLSGFLITYLMFHEIRSYQKIDVKAFYMRRFFRIWPLYILAILIGFILVPYIFNVAGHAYKETAQPIYYLSFLANVDFLMNGVPQAMILAVLWSLSIEEQFYIFWPLIMFFAWKRFLPKAYSLLAFSVIFMLFNYKNFEVNIFSTFAEISNLVVGALLAYYAFHKPNFLKLFRNLKRLWIYAIYTIGALLILSNWWLKKMPLVYTLFLIVIPVFFAFIIAEQSYSRNSFLKLGKYTALSYLGKISYGLYVLHGLAIAIVYLLFPKGLEWFVLKFILSFLLTIVIAWLSYNFFEQPFLKMKKRFER